MMAIEPVPLHEAARERYLNYALSVITARALPDVRDGMKPVQRRILYTMFKELSLHPGGRYRKCAAIVGEVMGKFHPHGDQSIYDALVRMAQDFSLLHPLVDGQGNFGSLDGDPPAAMRYTEAKLFPLAEELLTEIGKDTVDFRGTYDGQRMEPVVLPAQYPQLLVNGSEGIAVGMATRIPPHNLGEVVDACVAFIDDTSIDTEGLMKYIKGPDFPTGGKILTDRADLLKMYQTGQGTMRVRALWHTEKDGRRHQIILTSVPYGQNKAKLIERIGHEVAEKKLPLVIDVRDESTEDVRVVLDIKNAEAAEPVMAYLFKHTPLEGTWSANLTALIPDDDEDVLVAKPARLSLQEIIRHWCLFRFRTTRRRFEYELRKLRERIHILEGFEIVFDMLDEAIRIIRNSEGKRDAAGKLMRRFKLSDLQVEAILELKLYKLAKLEILAIREELDEKRTEAARIEAILASGDKLWNVVRTELVELRGGYAQKRRTEIGGRIRELTYDEDAYIVAEDTFVVVTRGGWIKRQSSFSNLSKIRVRDDDEIGWLFKAGTRSTITFLSSDGVAYTMRVDDVPSTTGYGDAVQTHFKFNDGASVVGVISNDQRQIIVDLEAPRNEDDPDQPWGFAMTKRGRVLRWSQANHMDPSNKSGRKYARLNPGDGVLNALPCAGTEWISVATQGGNALCFLVSEVGILKAAGKGVTGIKLKPDEPDVVGVDLVEQLGGIEVITNGGRELTVTPRKYEGTRGGRGGTVLRRGTIDEWTREPMVSLLLKDRPPAADDSEMN